tara:strand:+ start:83 stop:904 length:822 start_codon:yes stop_codon:yes gene_type:complete
MFNRILLILLLLFVSCSKNDKAVYEPSIKKNPFEIYKEAIDAFNINDFFYASEKFNEAEFNFTNQEFAAKSAIMSSYSLYAINLYDEAEKNLERYLISYPADKNVIYAHYLLAIIYFEQIDDEKHDLKPLLISNDKINLFLKKYPNTEYAIDLKFKKGLIQNQFAAKELYIAKYYISVQKWVPAINRLKLIVKDYNETIFIEEALHRLVEINYHIGLEEEAKKYASILGYNFNSSEWFEKSYKILNKDYKKILKSEKEKDKKGLFKKIIKMIK